MSGGSSLLGWLGILRLGLVQSALGSIIVLTTSTLNRVMVVELALPALLPGLLVGLHHAVQLSRPRLGHGSDVGGRRTPWIVGGMGLLALGAIMAAVATTWLAAHQVFGLVMAVAAFIAIGIGIGSAGTSLLVLLAKQVAEQRRPAAAMLVWVMMIAGFIVTAGLAGHFLDPFSLTRLIAVTTVVCASAFVVACVAVYGVESGRPASRSDVAVGDATAAPVMSFRSAMAVVWGEAESRRFTVFVFVSMLAYSAQDLILEPFAGTVFGYTPGQSTQLAALQNAGTLLGMISLGILGSVRRGGGSPLRSWAAGGCIASAIALAALAVGGRVAGDWPLRANVVVLGVANGVFAVAAIGSMMTLAGRGAAGREGVRMGLWGAAQATAFAAGGVLGTGLVDLVRHTAGSASVAYSSVFCIESVLFLASAHLAMRGEPQRGRFTSRAQSGADIASLGESTMKQTHHDEPFDVVVIGGGPAGATAANDLARSGRTVALLDRAGRIKPCGGAVPPRLMRDFDIPESLLVARVSAARMVSPTSRKVDMPIDGGYVGMVDREHFDEWLRTRAENAGATRIRGTFTQGTRDPDGCMRIGYSVSDATGARVQHELRARTIIGADGANSAVAKQCVPGADSIRYVAAYHEIVRAPQTPHADYDGARCDVYYQGRLSPDFYAWIFPHGETVSVGVGSARKGFSLRSAVDDLRRSTGLGDMETVRREGAPIPLRPLKRWDDGRQVVLAGDAAGVVAPASGEGIFYAMTGGRLAAEAVDELLITGDVRALRQARRRFVAAHGRVFWILGLLQRYWYSSDRRREQFVSICRDPDVQQLTWQAYMHKELVRARPMAHVRIFFKDVAHLLGVARA